MSQYPSASKTENDVVHPLWRNNSGLIGWKWLDGLVYHFTNSALTEIFEANLETQGERHGGILGGLRSFMVYLGF